MREIEGRAGAREEDGETRGTLIPKEFFDRLAQRGGMERMVGMKIATHGSEKQVCAK